jgi:type II secretory pathway component GspD/PulD (secretin)
MRGMFHNARRPVLGVLIAAGILTGTAVAALAADIPWKQAKFNWTFFDSDTQKAIEKIVTNDDSGLRIQFKGDVPRTPINDIAVDDTPQAVFSKFLTQNDLEYSYDAPTKTITIFKKQSEDLIVLKYIETRDLEAAKRRLELLGEIKSDVDNHIVLLRGTQEQVARLRKLTEELDGIAADRVKNAVSQEEAQAKRAESEAKAQEAKANAAAKEAENTSRAEVSRIRTQMMRDIVDTKVEIIPVRYATVGASSQTFQGETVALPGIDETLRALLGLGGKTDDKNQAAGLDSKTKQMVADLKSEMGVVPPEISIDPRSNSIIVRGTPSAIAQVKELVRRLDKPLPLIEIEVMIVNAQKGITDELGVKWASARKNKGIINTGIASDNAVYPGNAIDPKTLLPTDFTTSSGTVASFVFNGSYALLQAQINALSQESKAQTLWSPRITTINNLKAQISNDRTKYAQTNAGANSSGTLQKIPAGLKLAIVPSMIMREDTGDTNLIRLNVEASNKDVTFDASNNASSNGNDVLTQVVIPDGSTFVLGGLTNDTATDTKDGVPYLKDVPLLGHLFRTDSTVASTTETIFFITPHILKTDEAFASDLAQRRYLPTAAAARADLDARTPLVKPNSVLLEEDE